MPKLTKKQRRAKKLKARPKEKLIKISENQWNPTGNQRKRHRQAGKQSNFGKML
jgi:hypothetical protein